MIDTRGAARPFNRGAAAGSARPFNRCAAAGSARPAQHLCSCRLRSPGQPLCSCRHWRANPPWLQAAPAAIAMATNVVSAISASEAPAVAVFFVWASMHQGHCVIWAMPSAMSSFVLLGIASSLNAFCSNSRNARYTSGTSSRIFLNCVLTSTSWNCITASLRLPKSGAAAPRLLQAVEPLGAAGQDLALGLRRQLGAIGDQLRSAGEEAIGVRIVGRPEDLVRADVVREHREAALDGLERD